MNSNKSSIALHQFASVMIFQATENIVLSNGVLIPKGYCNLTQILKAAREQTNKKKDWSHYFENKVTQEYLDELSLENKQPILNSSKPGNPGTAQPQNLQLLIIVNKGGYPDEQGTWGHIDVALHLAQWASPKMAVWANKTLRHVIENNFQALTPESEKAKQELQKVWNKLRTATKDSFWWLTDDIKQYIEKYGSDNPRFHYMNAFKVMSVGLFGKEPNQIKKELGISDSGLNRDHFGEEALRRIDDVQRLAKVKITTGIKPSRAVAVAIDDFGYTPIDYKN